jgi:hypothetical protein
LRVSKITRKKLGRGTKLVIDDVYPPLTQAAGDINSISINKDQLKASWAPFRINLSVPYIASDLQAAGFHVPFVLPPLQDWMQFDTVSKAYVDGSGNNQTLKELFPVNTTGMPKIFLDEVSFGFDQRDAPCAIASQYYSDVNGLSQHEGKLSYDNIVKYDIRLAITEKDPLFFVPVELRTADMEKPHREVWSVDLPHINFANDVFSLNPFVVTDISEQIDPYKTYVASIYAPGVTGGQQRTQDTSAVALVSVELSLRFRCELLEKDLIAARAENVPSQSLNPVARSTTANAIQVTSPMPGDKITADTESGVNTAIATIDSTLRSKLYGGFSKNTERGVSTDAISEEIASDSAYEVLTVPLFQNSAVGGVANDGVFEMPYSNRGEANGDAILIDRRVIPITYPMLIEHVIVGLNWQPFAGGALGVATGIGLYAPNVTSWTYEFGVGIGTGLKADDFDYAQVAYSTFAPLAQPWLGVVDRIRAGETTGLPNETASTYKHNLELRCIPIVTTSGNTGPAYNMGAGKVTAPQGPPCMVGRAWSQTEARTTPRPTVGREQWIEVRGRIRDTAGAWAGSDRIVVGYQGVFVYIIGRKFLSS